MIDAHHKLGASAAHRWIACPGSVRFTDESPDTAYSLEGTQAHLFAAAALNGTPISDMVWNTEDRNAIDEYVGYCLSAPGSKHVEVRLKFDPYIPGGFGTADFVAFHDRTLEVVDLKFGRGVQVFAKDNPQGMLYALGALNEFGFLYDPEIIRITIHQPRLNHVDTWELPVADLLTWANTTLHDAVAATLSPDAPLVPGDKQCQWCPLRATCPALQAKIIEAVTAGFDHDDALTLSELLGWVDLARAWASAIEARGMDTLMADRDVPGWKLVSGRRTRQWDGEVETYLRGLLGEGAYKRTVISPAQAEKQIGKTHEAWPQIEEQFITWTEGKPTLARESSSKPAITSNVTKGFDS